MMKKDRKGMNKVKTFLDYRTDGKTFGYSRFDNVEWQTFLTGLLGAFSGVRFLIDFSGGSAVGIPLDCQRV